MRRTRGLPIYTLSTVRKTLTRNDLSPHLQFRGRLIRRATGERRNRQNVWGVDRLDGISTGQRCQFTARVLHWRAVLRLPATDARCDVPDGVQMARGSTQFRGLLEPSSSAPANGEANKLQRGDRAAHDWYRFILSFPPHLVREYVTRFDLNPFQTVLDPFCGTGTTVVECKKLGIPAIGTEANPMAHFAAHVKVDWDVDPDGLVEHATKVAGDVETQLDSEGIGSGRAPLFDAPLGRHRLRDLRVLPAEQFKLLLAQSISPIPLHKTLVLLEHLNRRSKDRYFDHERLALARSLVTSIGNLHFGPEVGIGPAKLDVPVVDTWLDTVVGIADDIRQLSRCNSGQSTVYLADARQLRSVLQPRSVDAVITSPPYPNEKDYTRTTRLESVLLGFIRNKEELRELKKGLVRSNTRGVYRADNDDQWVADHLEINRIASDIEARRIEMRKTSGFERMYARVTKLYFGGMAKHLADLREILSPGARLAYVVGDQASYLRIMIRTGQILADIAKSLGYEVIGIDLFRTRMATATREQLREEVVLLRWNGGKRSAGGTKRASGEHRAGK